MTHDFPLESGLTLLNHASYGIATRRSLMTAAGDPRPDRARSHPAVEDLAEALRTAARVAARFTGLTAAMR